MDTCACMNEHGDRVKWDEDWMLVLEGKRRLSLATKNLQTDCFSGRHSKNTVYIKNRNT